MININNKPWDKLKFSDIQKVLDEDDGENLFYEYKSDQESPKKLMKEISAFANTYGGYIFLGVNDDKSIGGCINWTEQRIHTSIHDNITPTPNFTVKKFRPNGKIIFVIKIEEGTAPPYVTSEGYVCERVSSGSFKIKDSAKLTQLYHKRKDQLQQIADQIELPDLELDAQTRNNIFAYLDMGFSVTCSETTNLRKNFLNLDLESTVNLIKKFTPSFSVSRVGFSYMFTFGEVSQNDNNGNFVPVSAGIHNFMEITVDGSVRCRIMLPRYSNTIDKVNMAPVLFYKDLFKQIYENLLGGRFSKIFVNSYKYEKLVVLKQFTPIYDFGNDCLDINEEYREALRKHKNRYGNNLIVTNNRVPVSGFDIIDRRYFDEQKGQCNNENLLSYLFASYHGILGYIDSLSADEDG